MKVELFSACDCVGEYNKCEEVRKLVWGDMTFIRHDHDDSSDSSTGVIVDFYFVCSECGKRWREKTIAS